MAVAARRVRPRSWLWSDDPEDWRTGCTADTIRGRLRGVDDGEVVLLHDGLATVIEDATEDRSATVAAVSPLCAMIRDRGLGFAVLPET